VIALYATRQAAFSESYQAMILAAAQFCVSRAMLSTAGDVDGRTRESAEHGSVAVSRSRSCAGACGVPAAVPANIDPAARGYSDIAGRSAVSSLVTGDDQ
jgi:hypothetical protein